MYFSIKLESIERRYANIDDISVNDVLFLTPSLRLKSGGPLFRWLKQSLPRILNDSLEPCHFHQLNGFHKPLPYFRHML